MCCLIVYVGRQEILQTHIQKQGLPLGEDVTVDSIAASTTGFTGADLANLINEAALLAGRSDKGDTLLCFSSSSPSSSSPLLFLFAPLFSCSTSSSALHLFLLRLLLESQPSVSLPSAPLLSFIRLLLLILIFLFFPSSSSSCSCFPLCLRFWVELDSSLYPALSSFY